MNALIRFLYVAACVSSGALAAPPTASETEQTQSQLLATLKRSVNVDGLSFKIGESFVAETIDKVTSTAVTTRNGRTYRIPLLHLDIRQVEPQRAGASNSLIVITKAEYGVPRLRTVNVTRRVQELVNQTPPGTTPEIVASVALLPKQTARDGRFSGTKSLRGYADSSGNVIISGGSTQTAQLTISYTVNGSPRAVHATEGERVQLK